ncbi:MAG: hypothetical protein K9N48_09045 [Verrucomicrobia bacterium]|nr:hypothetical protein [Verrucomicrobiota bacterium]MCF7708743.1 hypothetical protein [Verrucomicrobiota bacterium]
MMDMIHVTMQYSNAVLVALLPHFSDFSQKLELPVPRPITTNHVQRFVTGGPVIEGYPVDVQGHLVLTNGYEFWYSWGHVTGFLSPGDYYAAQDVERVPEFFGTLRLDQSEAVVVAREALAAAGYANHLPITSKKPQELRGPKKYKDQIIPHYHLVWKSEDKGQGYVKVDVDGESGFVTGLSISATNLWRSPPKIPVQPELESEYRRRVMEGCQIHSRDPPPERQAPQ